MGSPGLRTGCLYLCLALLAALILLTTITIHWVIATTNLGLVSNNGQEGQREKMGKSSTAILDRPRIPQLAGRWREGQSLNAELLVLFKLF